MFNMNFNGFRYPLPQDSQILTAVVTFSFRSQENVGNKETTKIYLKGSNGKGENTHY